MESDIPKKILDLLYSAAYCLCGKLDPGYYITLKDDSHHFRIYPYIVTVISNGKKNIRRCLLIFHFSGPYIEENIKIKFENTKEKMLFQYSNGYSTKNQKFIETDYWKWFIKKLTLKVIEEI